MITRIDNVLIVVEDLDAVIDRTLSDEVALVGEIVEFESLYRLCYLRGPENIIVGLAEQIQG